MSLYVRIFPSINVCASPVPISENSSINSNYFIQKNHFCRSFCAFFFLLVWNHCSYSIYNDFCFA